MMLRRFRLRLDTKRLHEPRDFQSMALVRTKRALETMLVARPVTVPKNYQ